MQHVTCTASRSDDILAPMDINRALLRAGSVSALARILGVSRQAVQQFKNCGLPARRVDQLRRLRPEWFLEKV